MNNFFNEQFAMANVGLDSLVEDARQSPVSLRSQGFLKFISVVLPWFKTHESLTEVHLIGSTKPFVNNEGDLDIIVRHSFTINLKGSTLGYSKEVLNEMLSSLCIDYLPYCKMAAGSFKISREDTLVQTFLKLSDDNEAGYRTILQLYGHQLHMTFGTLTLRSEIEYVPQ